MKIMGRIPSAAKSIKAKHTVHVCLSLGAKKVSVPARGGRSLRAARITAVERGLTIGNVAWLYWPTDQPDQVVAQDPPPATTDLQSPAVNFLVSNGPLPLAYLCPNFQGKPVGVVQAQLQQAGFQNIQVTQVQIPGSQPGDIIQQVPLPGSKVSLDTVFAFQVSQ